MVDITVVDKISFKDVDIKSFRVSCQSHVCTEDSINFIGVLFLKCPEGAKSIHNRSIKPGYIHIKSIRELNERSKSVTLHQQCFETISSGNRDDFLLLGFSFDFGSDSKPETIKLNSSTFNKKLSRYFNGSGDREGMEFFTPILQTVSKKYILQRKRGFTLNVEHIPINSCLMYANIYPEFKYKSRVIHFETRKEFYGWCRKYYKSEEWFDEKTFELLFNTKNPDWEILESEMRQKILIINRIQNEVVVYRSSDSNDASGSQNSNPSVSPKLIPFVLRVKAPQMTLLQV
jgi:hypothetical protein